MKCKAALFSLLAAMTLFSGCGEDEKAQGGGGVEPAFSPVSITADGIGIALESGEASLTLLPRVLIDGQWREGGGESDCDVGPNQLNCPLEGIGGLTVDVENSTFKVTFNAAVEAVVEGISLEGRATLPGATGWLSNGFQSWSQSGVIAIGEQPGDGELRDALTTIGDIEVMRDGDELSWWYSFAGGANTALFAGALTAEKWRSWVQINRAGGNSLQVRFVSGETGEMISVGAGESLSSESWLVELGTDVNTLFENYGKSIPSRRANKPLDAAAGWNSWYELWDQVSEEDIRGNAALVRDVFGERLPSDTPIRIVIDDGWQVAWGEWEPNEKFPSGLDGLASDLKAQGFEVGVWLAPMLVHQDSSLCTEHPEWFVEGTYYTNTFKGNMNILDPTNPGAAQHLADVIARLVGWGYDFLKIDFLFSGAFNGIRAEDVTGMEAYNRAMEIIRAAAGEDTVLFAIGAPHLPTVQYADAWRLGADIAAPMTELSFIYIMNQARSIAARWALCHSILCDADPLLLRDLEKEEVETAGWIAAFAGGALFLSDDLTKLPEERWTWGLDETRVTAALSGLPSIPEEMFDGGAAPERLTNVIEDLLAGVNRHFVPSIWKLPDGTRVFLNSTDEEKVLESVTAPPRSVRVLP